jgi:hypothetical protein
MKGATMDKAGGLFLAGMFVLLTAAPLPAAVVNAGVPSLTRGMGVPAGSRAGVEHARKGAEYRILAVLRTRIPDPRVLGRMEEKLAELEPLQVRLASSLCDRIAVDERSAGADIAFTLMAALIALS